MLAANYNITLDRAADYSFVLVINDANDVAVDLDGDDFVSDIRLISSKKQALEFTTAFVTDGSDGKVLLTLTPLQTKTLQAGTLYEYDVFVIRSVSGQTIRLIEGTVTVRAQRTNDV